VKTFAKSAALALTVAILSVGAAAAAEACACCKDGEKMACCDKMQSDAAAPKPGEPAPSQHKH
jgi:hypothetical protein